MKAVSYGTFAPDERGDLFPPRARVREDFAAIAAAGFNCIRTYTAPPDWLMHEARAAGLRVLAGIYWGGENCDFDDPRALARASGTVVAAVHRLRRFPDVVLAYLIGNEIPALVARFHGRRTIEHFLRALYRAGKAEDPAGLFSYGNYGRRFRLSSARRLGTLRAPWLSVVAPVFRNAVRCPPRDRRTRSCSTS